MAKRRTIQEECRDEHPCSRLFDELIADIVTEANGKNRLFKLKAFVSLAEGFAGQVFFPSEEVKESWPCECNLCAVEA